jgi:hypothetical protein
MVNRIGESTAPCGRPAGRCFVGEELPEIFTANDLSVSCQIPVILNATVFIPRRRIVQIWPTIASGLLEWDEEKGGG